MVVEPDPAFLPFGKDVEIEKHYYSVAACRVLYRHGQAADWIFRGNWLA
jgi:hypothetical protein